MYIALFMAPWVLVYALSTAAMNHRDLFQKRDVPPPFEKEREFVYDGAFDGLTPKQMAAQILLTIGMDGAHHANMRDGILTINRQDPVAPRRITYHPQTRTVRIERQVFQPHAFLERMHRRRGFQHDYFLEDAWAFSVDLFIAAMVFWAFSGLWMWWQLKATRGLGLLCLCGGAALFAFFLAVI
jgi:hypothetical protein